MPILIQARLKSTALPFRAVGQRLLLTALVFDPAPPADTTTTGSLGADQQETVRAEDRMGQSLLLRSDRKSRIAFRKLLRKTLACL